MIKRFNVVRIDSTNTIIIGTKSVWKKIGGYYYCLNYDIPLAALSVTSSDFF
jgi:hypothetical protein